MTTAPKRKPKEDPITGEITQWSFSRWTTHRDCARRAYYKFIKRLPEPGGPALQRGTEIHDAAKNVIQGKLKDVPDDLKSVKKMLLSMSKRKGVHPELELAVTKRWTPTGWFERDVYGRAKLDVGEKVGKVWNVADWKTGKLRTGDAGSDYILQLELYATFGFAHHPDADRVEARLIFTDQDGKEIPSSFERSEFPALMKRWEKRLKPMLNDRTFEPSPGDACRWCAYKKASGGPCPF